LEWPGKWHPGQTAPFGLISQGSTEMWISQSKEQFKNNIIHVNGSSLNDQKIWYAWLSLSRWQKCSDRQSFASNASEMVSIYCTRCKSIQSIVHIIPKKGCWRKCCREGEFALPISPVSNSLGRKTLPQRLRLPSSVAKLDHKVWLLLRMSIRESCHSSTLLNIKQNATHHTTITSSVGTIRIHCRNCPGRSIQSVSMMPDRTQR
jgi:hypothetical protein